MLHIRAERTASHEEVPVSASSFSLQPALMFTDFPQRIDITIHEQYRSYPFISRRFVIFWYCSVPDQLQHSAAGAALEPRAGLCM